MHLALRPGTASDFPVMLDLWTAGWSLTLPQIDFAARRPWMEERLAEHLAEGAAVIVAEAAPGGVVGFVVVNPSTGYLDQIGVAPEAWGAGVAVALLAESKRIAPGGLSLHVNVDNPRAVRFYEREGFLRVGEGVNPRSGLPVFHYRWSGTRA